MASHVLASHAFRRLMTAATGYLLAALAAGYLTAVLATFSADQFGDDARRIFIKFGLYMATFIFLTSAFPASCFIAYGEYDRIKRWWYYAAAGCVTGAIFGAMLVFSGSKYPWTSPAVGVVAGLVYWLVSGRQAGDFGGASPRWLVGALLVAGVVLALTAMVLVVLLRPYGR